MKRDSVLLLGGTGFIGSALGERLAKEGIPFQSIGRHDAVRLEQLLPQCNTVVHLASATTPGASAKHPDLELGNITLTLRLLALLQTQPETHLIYFSSGGTVYGNPDRLPVTEDTPIVPLSNYGAGKAAQEAFCQAFRTKGHAVTILRPSNAYGPGQTMRQSFGLIRTMLECACLGTPLEIWGDGGNIRDFIYIEDIVEACTRFIKQPQDSGTYNLGSGIGYTVNQVREIVEAMCDKKLITTYRPGRGTDVHNVVLDIAKLDAHLDWQPGVGLSEGIARTWKWLQQT